MSEDQIKTLKTLAEEVMQSFERCDGDDTPETITVECKAIDPLLKYIWDLDK